MYDMTGKLNILQQEKVGCVLEAEGLVRGTGRVGGERWGVGRGGGGV